MLFVVIGVTRSGLRALLLRLRSNGHNLASIVVIGESSSAGAFIRTVAGEAGTGYRVVAHISDPKASDDIAYVLHELSKTVTIDEVVIAPFNLSADQLQAIVAEPSMRGIRLRAVPELDGLPPPKC